METPSLRSRGKTGNRFEKQRWDGYSRYDPWRPLCRWRLADDGAHEHGIRVASGELPNEMVVFLRNGFGLVALLPWIRAYGGVSNLATAQFPQHLLRSLAGLAAMIGALSGLLAAVAMVSVRGMSATEPTVRTVFYFSAISTVVSTVPLLWAWRTPTVPALALMALAGFFATKGQLLLTRGYALAPAARVGPYTYTTVIFASAIGWILWSEVPDGMTIA
ncbi:MAG: DMT family transporter, partial [Gammaproteobacteria bacterium]